MNWIILVAIILVVIIAAHVSLDVLITVYNRKKFSRQIDRQTEIELKETQGR